MNAIGWITVVIRLMALWLVIGVLVGLPTFLSNLYTDFGEQTAFFQSSLRAGIVAELATLAAAAALWFKSATFARWVLPHGDASQSRSRITAADLERAAFVVVGAYLVIYSLPTLVEIAAARYAMPRGFAMEQQSGGRMNARTVGVAIQIVAGLGLIVGSNGIANIVAKVRSRSIEPTERRS